MAFFYEQGISSSDSTHRAGGGYGAKAFFYQQGISSGDTTHKAGGGYGAKPLTWHFLLAVYLQATPLTEQVGMWSNTTNMAFFTKFANLPATPLTDPVGDMEQNH